MNGIFGGCNRCRLLASLRGESLRTFLLIVSKPSRNVIPRTLNLVPHSAFNAPPESP